MDKDLERNEDMAISKEQEPPMDNKSPKERERAKQIIKAITAKHPKLLKKLAEN